MAKTSLVCERKISLIFFCDREGFELNESHFITESNENSLQE